MRFTYTNYKGSTGERNSFPLFLFYGFTKYHPKPQWLLLAIDKDKNALRTFALKDIQWRKP